MGRREVHTLPFGGPKFGQKQGPKFWCPGGLQAKAAHMQRRGFAIFEKLGNSGTRRTPFRRRVFRRCRRLFRRFRPKLGGSSELAGGKLRSLGESDRKSVDFGKDNRFSEKFGKSGNSGFRQQRVGAADNFAAPRFSTFHPAV